MTHYEERLEHDLDNIRKRVRDLTARVDVALGDALTALLTNDQELANDTILGDLVVNRRVRKLDGKCHAFVARHLPSAGHLRLVSSVMRLSVALERIGDYAVVIARELGQLESDLPEKLAADFEMVGDQARTMLRQAGQAFDEGNADMARGTLALGHAIDVSLRSVFRDLLAEGETGSRSVNDLFALAGAVNRLSRVADQAENICEETIFAATGEMTKKRLSSVLFVAERDDAYTQLAVGYARKAFSEDNRFESAGWSEAAEIEPRARIFMEQRGLDSGHLTPVTLDELGPEILQFDVVVSLEGRPEGHIAHDLPFRTVVLEWDVGVPPNDLDQDRAEAALKQAFGRIRDEIGRLMEMMRGKEVD
jgi:phosphate transport system protein